MAKNLTLAGSITGVTNATINDGGIAGNGLHLKNEGWLYLYNTDNSTKYSVNASSAGRLDFYNRTTSAYANIRVANVSGTTGTFTDTIQATTAKLTNLTDNYIPYHISDGSGLANSVIQQVSSNIGIGITPTQKLHVSGNILASGEVTAYSDKRLKSDVKPLSTAIDKISKLNPVEYIKDDKKSIGFIAQELREIYPEFVLGVETENSYLSVNYSQIVAVLTKSIQEQQAMINELQKEVKELRNKII
ncbi:tail fiber domain-containing protein [Gaoshiqia sediminis]|uniref:Tail fiber domain-containing protein n=1 Tax=Gaoshiqia sediminis TaxID=2986998 RepID=A0AA41Y750_9BACT|nr:tail fiber domain-containing protein [Gaoshiqia sediminis]MCW0484649.1 tail fiber domain-containing protein [Gaoshiqia sediminis]